MLSHSQTISLRSRVTPDVSWTTASRVSVRRLMSVDLPTFGKPTMATTPRSGGGGVASRFSSSIAHGSVTSRGRPAVVLDDEPLPEPAQLALDLERRLAVTLAAARQAVEAHRLAPDDRDRREVADLPLLRAVDRAADDGHVLLQRDHRRARLDVPGNADFCRVPSTKTPSTSPVVDDLAHSPHGVAIGLAAAHRDRPEGADELAEPRHAVRLDLREEVERARRGAGDARDVDPARSG